MSVWVGCAALALLLSPAWPQGSAAPAVAAAGEPAQLAAWREALLLDEAPRVVAAGRAAVSPNGELADNGEALALVARALAQSGETDGALLLLEGASAQARAGGWVALEHARIDLANDRLEQALGRLCKDAGATQLRFPERSDSYLLVGRALARRGELARAAAWLRSFLERAPYASGASAAWYMLGQEALERRDAATARACFERQSSVARWHAYFRARSIQLREHPNDPLPRLGLAQLWLQADQPERARDLLRELLARFPESCQARLALAEAERKLGELAAARASYAAALECDPDLWEARLNRGLLAKMLGEPDAARADLETLLAGPAGSDPRWQRAHLELARLLLDAGEAEAAQKRYASYRQLGGSEPLGP